MVKVETVKFESLPFVEVDGTAVVNFWKPDRSGDYSAQNELGREYAREFLQLIRAEQNPALFGSIIRAIAAGGEYGGVEVGFCHALGVELIGLQ